MDFFWRFHLWKKICFQHGNQFPRWIVFCFAIHHCLLWVQKIRNQTFSAISKKSNVNLLLGVILFIRTKGFKTLLRICVNANVYVFERTHDSVFCALCTVFPGSAVITGIVKTATDKPCNECKCSDTNAVFQRAIFLILAIRNDNRSSSIDVKTSDCPSRICLYYRYLEIALCQWLFS